MQDTCLTSPIYWKKEPGFNSVIWSRGRTEYKLLHILVITICHLNTKNVSSEQEALPFFGWRATEDHAKAFSVRRNNRLQTGQWGRWKALLGILVLKGQVPLNKTFTLYMCVEMISHLILGALPGTHFLIHFFSHAWCLSTIYCHILLNSCYLACNWNHHWYMKHEYTNLKQSGGRSKK